MPRFKVSGSAARHLIAALVVCSLLQATTVQAQSVCIGSETLSSQAEVAAFAADGCTELVGTLTISGADITDLSGLRSLTEVGGLIITGNDALQNLDGLGSLATVDGSLSISENESLTSLDGLERLNIVRGNLMLYANTALTSLEGLASLFVVDGFFDILLNPRLESLEGLESLISIGQSLRVSTNDRLTSLSGLEGLAYVGGDVVINDNGGLSGVGKRSGGALQASGPRGAEVVAAGSLLSVAGHILVSDNRGLTSLSALSGLAAVGGNVTIRLNEDLVSLTGLASLTSIGGGLCIQDNAALTNILGLAGLADAASAPDNLGVMTDTVCSASTVTAGEHIILKNNPQLARCGVLEPYVSNAAPPGPIEISGNAEGCDEAGILNEALAGNVDLFSQADVTAFAAQGTTEITGDLFISGPDITDLSGLASVTSVGGNLIVQNNGQLASLTGLDQITSVEGNLEVVGNDLLTDLTGLASVAWIGGELTVQTNDQLVSLAGLGPLSTVGGVLIESNPSLQSLEALRSLKTVAGDLRMAYHPALTTLAGLESLQRVGGNLTLQENDLVDLSSLQSLVTVGASLTILDADRLTSLDGLDALTSVGGYLTLGLNDALERLGALPSLTSLGGLALQENPRLTSLAGLERIPSLESDLLILDNTSLTSLAGLDGLTSVGGLVYVLYNEKLQSLEGLGALSAVGGTVYVGINHALTRLDGLESLKVVGNVDAPTEDDHSLLIYANPALTDLAGLASLTSVEDDLLIALNGPIATLSSLPTLDAVGASLLVQLNDGVVRFNDDGTPLEQAALPAAHSEVGALPPFATEGHRGRADRLREAGPGFLSDVTPRLVPTPLRVVPGTSGTTTYDVQGDVNITGNPALTDFRGLEWVATVGGSVVIFGNGACETLTGLEALTRADGGLVLYANEKLQNIEALAGVTTLGGLGIAYNPALKSLRGLEGVTDVGFGITIASNGPLETLESLGSVVAVAGTNAYVVILDNDGSPIPPELLTLRVSSALGSPDVQVVTGWMHGVAADSDEAGRAGKGGSLATATGTTLGWYMVVARNPALQSLRGLNWITSVEGSLEVADNPLLTSLDGLDGITSIGGALRIAGNDALTSLAPLAALATDDAAPGNIGTHTDLFTATSIALDDHLVLEDNASLTDCGLLKPYLTNPLRPGPLRVSGNGVGCDYKSILAAEDPASEDDVFDGDVTLPDQAVLDAFAANGYREITGTLRIEGAGVTSLGGLETLTHVDGDLVITGALALERLAGLDGLVSVGGDLIIEKNASLATLEGLDRLLAVKGLVRIDENAKLTALSGLESLIAVGGALRITSNGVLTTLKALTTLSADPGAPGNLGATAGDHLIVTSNPALMDCEVLRPYLANATPPGVIVLTGNGVGCDAEAITNPPDEKDDVTLTDQAGLDDFAASGADQVLGSLRIEGPAVTDLSGLGALLSVAGDVRIEGTAVEDLTGLEGLATIGGDLVIEGNSNLASLAALSRLTAVGGSIRIIDNRPGGSAARARGTASVLRAVPATAMMDEAAGFEDSTSAGGNLVIAGNATLETLVGLGGLTSVGGFVRITQNPALTSLEGLERITRIGGGLLIAQNPVLASPAGLAGVLAAPEAPENLGATAGRHLVVQDNPRLTGCRIFRPFVQNPEPPGTVAIRRNGAGCEAPALADGEDDEVDVPDPSDLPLPGGDEPLQLLAADRNVTDRFGTSVALANRVAAIGAPGDDDNVPGSGSVYVYEKTARGTWAAATRTAKLYAATPSTSEGFGSVVAATDDVIVVGARVFVVGGRFVTGGLVHVFERQADGTWAEATQLRASDWEEDDVYGEVVAVSGNVIAVGARLDDDPATDAGAVYVYEKPEGSTWAKATETKLTAPDGVSDQYFGVAVAVSGNVLAVGASQDSERGALAGAAYVFEKPEGGTWAEASVTKLTAPAPAPGTFFGGAVSISGNVLVVGADREDDLNAGLDAGAAYVFERPAAGPWSKATVTRLGASARGAGDLFGTSVAVAGSVVVVGASRSDAGGTDAGAAYLYARRGGVWPATETVQLSPRTPGAFALFGTTVAVSDEAALVGSPNSNDPDGLAITGTAYLYTRPRADAAPATCSLPAIVRQQLEPEATPRPYLDLDVDAGRGATLASVHFVEAGTTTRRLDGLTAATTGTALEASTGDYIWETTATPRRWAGFRLTSDGAAAYAYEVVITNSCGRQAIAEASGDFGVGTGTEGPSGAGVELPATLTLVGSYPNPFNPRATIRYGLPEAGSVRLAVYDLLGREVTVLVDGMQVAGWYNVAFEAGTLPTGVYLYRVQLRTGGRQEVRTGQAVLLR
ncbi:hypothetical protein AWN76_013885 [Rhodothermaceae bacterium RA]|nr:hypothetical protein AWN76_013885 [Rhodothermaceae bacterium RA]